MTTTNITFQLRRDNTTNWNTFDPVLQPGEIGIDTTLNKFKIGKGGNFKWSDLEYGSILASELTAAIEAHNTDTTNVHGIADTAALATKTYADNAVSTAISSEVTARNSAISAHESDTTNVHGISNTADLATKTYVNSAVTSLSNTASSTYIPVSDIGNPDGVASLDSSGQIPLSQLSNLIDSAPATLDTLNELAAALADDPNFSTTITNSLGTTNTNVSNLTTSLGTTNTNVSNLTTSVNTLSSTVTQFDNRIINLELGLGI